MGFGDILFREKTHFDWMWLTFIPGLICWTFVPFWTWLGDFWVIIGQSVAMDYFSWRYNMYWSQIESDAKDYRYAMFGVIFCVWDIVFFWFPSNWVFFLKPAWWCLIATMVRAYQIDVQGIDLLDIERENDNDY